MSRKEGAQRENHRSVWRAAGKCAVIAWVSYLLLQFGNTALVTAEVVGEEHSRKLVFLSAAIAVLVGVLIGGHEVRGGRLLLGIGSGAVFSALVGLLAAASGKTAEEMLGGFLWVLVASLIGGAAAALAVGKKRRHKRVKR